MPLIVESRRKKEATLRKAYPDARIIDLTSKGENPRVKFSPFYPHGDIPLPFSGDLTAQSVEGIWQGLKVFETHDIDTSKFAVTSMKGLKRTLRRYGTVLGHRKGVSGTELLDYYQARIAIYLPSYLWVLENCLQDEVQELRGLSANQTVLLLDYETNSDIKNLAKPLSHAGLVKRYCENNWELPG